MSELPKNASHAGAHKRGVVVILVLAGCGLFPSLSGLGEGTDASIVDAMSDTFGEASLPDASDATVTSDADAADGAGFCQVMGATAVFCEDFDEPTAKMPSDVGIPTLSGGGAMSISTARFLSSPRSLLTQTTTIDASASDQAGLYFNLSTVTSFSTLTLSFDGFVTSPVAARFVFGSIFMNGGSVVSILVNSDNTMMVQEGAYAAAPMFVNHTPVAIDLSTSTWHHFVLVLARASPSLSSLQVDSTVVDANHPLDARFTITTLPGVGVGMEYTGGPAVSRLAYTDNILVTRAP